MLDNYTRVNDYTRMIKLIEISRVEDIKLSNFHANVRIDRYDRYLKKNH